MKHQVVETETATTDVDDLRAFCRVVDLGSITGAAKSLGETKGGVSRRITRLERSLGVVLLRRSPRLVQATEDGAVYRASVGRVLEMLDEANAQARRALTAPSGHLRVTAPSDVGLTLMAPVVASFVERYPDITVEMVLTEALLDFDAHQIDVALRAGSALQDSALVAHRLLEIEARLYASPAYVKEHGAPKHPDQLDQHRLLLGQGGRVAASLTLRRGAEEHRLRFKGHAPISGSDFSFTREVALGGGGVALLPDVVARNDVTAGRLVPVLKEWAGFKGTLFVVHHATRLLTPKVRVFREHIIKEFTERCKKEKARGG
jgi:DNA-binding transcriptional LysR family regulator